MTIYFDMDGTLNEFYVGNWLGDILSENVRPYAEAQPRISEDALKVLAAQGYKLGIVSWLAKNASQEYNKKVRAAKKAWLKEFYPAIEWNEIHIVKYGTPKWKVVREKESILIDDENENRKNWFGLAYNPLEIEWGDLGI